MRRSGELIYPTRWWTIEERFPIVDVWTQTAQNSKRGVTPDSGDATPGDSTTPTSSD